MAVALRGPDAESWLTDVQDRQRLGASSRKRRQLFNAARRFNNSTATELAQIYSRPAVFAGASVGFNDIDSGTCGMAAVGVFDTYLATTGWDFCGGVGSPIGYFGK